MFRLFGRLLRLLVVGFLFGMIASALAAATAKRRMVSVGGPEDDHVELVAIFGSLDFRSVARSFRGGSLLSWFAGSQLDLRRAALDPLGADLEVRTIFAGTNVVVPEDWRVIVEGPAVFGANSAPVAPGAAPDAPELRVRALSLFGGMTVSAKAWDLAASEKTLVVGPDAAAPGDAADAPAGQTDKPTEGEVGTATGGQNDDPANGDASGDPKPAGGRRAGRRGRSGTGAAADLGQDGAAGDNAPGDGAGPAGAA